MTTNKSDAVLPAEQTTSTHAIPAIAVPLPPAAGTTTLQVQILPPPKLEFWEGPGFFPACAALVAVVITYFGLQRSTRKQIDAGAARSKEQLEHARDQAKADRDHSGAQANEERAHAARQATLDRLLEARQTLYTQLIDDYVDVLRMFGSMASPKFQSSAEDVLPLMKMAASVNKTWLLSDVPTSYAVRDFYSSLNEMHFTLSSCAKALQKSKRELDFAVAERDRQKEAAQTRANELSELLKDVNMAQRVGSEFQSMIKEKNRFIADSEANIENHNRAISVYADAYRNAHKEFMDIMVHEQTAMMKQINTVMAAARVELGLAGDINILDEQSIVMAARVKAALADYEQR